VNHVRQFVVWSLTGDQQIATKKFRWSLVFGGGGILQELESFKSWNPSRAGILQELESFKSWNPSRAGAALADVI